MKGKKYNRRYLWCSEDFYNMIMGKAEELRNKGHQTGSADLTHRLTPVIQDNIKFDTFFPQIKFNGFKRRPKLKKRGSFLDWFLIIVFLCVAFVTLIASMLITTTVEDSGVFDDYSDASEVLAHSKSALLSFDNTMLFVVVGLSTFVLLSSYFVVNHPAFFFVGVFLLFIAVVMAAMASNTMWIFADADTVSTVTALYPKLTYLMDKLPYYIAFMGTATLIVAYLGYLREEN